ncbi:hypothetical protein LAUMK4_03227 [Mycobacterium persicum]|uniref:Uncharacterized protein n=1 Tax=Mycobacterium persicum TaxID=1487726 RepID=A0ABY6RK75_9MYCO|nr:hypothetical protein LAUMK15_03537 [Mycobacterium persicum]VAZ95686.1 hypothetical protein LAUMK4_03227 [Mycobacterium persicum]
MLCADQAVSLGGRGGGQLRRQPLTGQRPPRPEVSRFVDAPPGLDLGDAQPVGQRRTQRAAQLFLAGLRAELIDQRKLRGSQPPRRALQTLQRTQSLGGGEHLKRQLTQPVQLRIERVEDLDDVVTTARTHA